MSSLEVLQTALQVFFDKKEKILERQKQCATNESVKQDLLEIQEAQREFDETLRKAGINLKECLHASNLERNP